MEENNYLINQNSDIKMSFKIMIQKVSKEELYEEFIVNHKSKKYLTNKYCCGVKLLNKCLKYYNLPTTNKKYPPLDISKEDLYELYINQLLSKDQIAKKFNTSKYDVYVKLKEYNIEKSKDLRVASYKKVMQEQYHVDNIMKSEEGKQKLKESLKEKYGVENIMFLPEKIQQAKNTLYEKYSVTHPLLVPEFAEKAKKTWIENYGVDHPTKNQKIKEKVQSTCLKHFGVQWACLRDEILLNYNNNSKPNLNFKKELLKYFSENEINREINISPYIYDFKVKDTLFEINPTISHNVFWCPFNETHISRITPEYHLNKSKIAEKNNFFCIHMWDWDNIPYILDLYINNMCLWEKLFVKKEYKENKEYLYCDNSKFDKKILEKRGYREVQQIPPRIHWYNIKTKEHVLIEGQDDQTIITDMKEKGFFPVYDCGVTILFKEINNK